MLEKAAIQDLPKVLREETFLQEGLLGEKSFLKDFNNH